MQKQVLEFSGFAQFCLIFLRSMKYSVSDCRMALFNTNTILFLFQDVMNDTGLFSL